jgi:Bromodomain
LIERAHAIPVFFTAVLMMFYLLQLTFDGRGTMVTDSEVSPRKAWEDALTMGEGILTVLGGRLRRCRAVFNRLCTSPFILDFLEPYPLNVAGASDYYRVVKAPMWLREVHNRLVDGAYDNEFDFAWDVRLVFANCLEYNAPTSDLHKAAQDLLSEFECLLCDWVHNVQDLSVSNLATGPWDDWGYLKYFDAQDCKENFCRETGLRVGEVSYFFNVSLIHQIIDYKFVHT